MPDPQYDPKSTRIPNEHGDLGKYDEVTEEVLRKVKGVCVAMLVVGGEQGSGFSVSCIDMAILNQLPDMLEHMARNIRNQQRGAILS